MDTYEGMGLLEMPSDNRNTEMPGIFRNIIKNIAKYNSLHLRKKRIEYALDNTYEKQLLKISQILNALKLNIL